MTEGEVLQFQDRLLAARLTAPLPAEFSDEPEGRQSEERSVAVEGYDFQFSKSVRQMIKDEIAEMSASVRVTPRRPIAKL